MSFPHGVKYVIEIERDRCLLGNRTNAVAPENVNDLLKDFSESLVRGNRDFVGERRRVFGHIRPGESMPYRQNEFAACADLTSRQCIELDLWPRLREEMWAENERYRTDSEPSPGPGYAEGYHPAQA